MYRVALNAAPSPDWTTAFYRPPRVRLAIARPAGKLKPMVAMGFFGSIPPPKAIVLFRTTPPRVTFWLRRIDGRIEYANSVVEE